MLRDRYDINPLALHPGSGKVTDVVVVIDIRALKEGDDTHVPSIASRALSETNIKITSIVLLAMVLRRLATFPCYN